MTNARLKDIVAKGRSMMNGWTDLTTMAEIRRDVDGLYLGYVRDDVGAGCEEAVLAGLPVEIVNAAGTLTLIHFHGGAFMTGSPLTHRNLALRIAAALNARVIVPDYRLTPEHAFPAQIEDAVRVYEAVLEQGTPPRQIVLSGDSAGGNLVITTMLTLAKKAVPLPALGLLLSPWTDMTRSGQSYMAARWRRRMRRSPNWPHSFADAAHRHPPTRPEAQLRTHAISFAAAVAWPRSR